MIRLSRQRVEIIILCTLMLLWAGWIAWGPSNAEGHRLERQVRSIERQALTGKLSLQAPGDAGRVLTLFQSLRRRGDLRSMLRIVECLNPPTLDAATRISILEALEVSRWSAPPPPAVQALLQAANGVPPTVRVTFHLAPGSAAPPKLFLLGNWNSEGQADALHGWKRMVMSQAGTLTPEAVVSLRLTRSREVYHVLVSSSAERFSGTLAEKTFILPSVESPRVIVVPRNVVSPVPRYEPAVAPTGRPIRVLLLGVDMGSWRALLPYMEQGRLPHLAWLFDHGTRATLLSMPGGYDSLPLFTSGLTGVLPPRHGILGQQKLYAFDIFRRAWPVWCIASRNGLKTGIVGWPGSWPPDQLSAFDVTDAYFAAGLLQKTVASVVLNDPSIRQFAQTFDFSLQKLQAAFGLIERITGRFDTYTPESLDLESRYTLSRHFAEPSLESIVSHFFDDNVVELTHLLSDGQRFDLLSFYIYQVDYLSHAFWKFFEPALYTQELLNAPVAYGFDRWLEDHAVKRPGKEAILLQAYERLDGYIGGFMDRADHIVLFSDHGALPGDPAGRTYDIQLIRLVALYYFREGQELSMEHLDWQQKGPEKRLLFQMPATAGRILADPFAAFLRRLRYQRTADRPPEPVFREVSVEDRAGMAFIRMRLDERIQPQDWLIDGSFRAPMDRLSGFNPVGAVHSMDGILILYGPAFKSGFEIASDVHLCDVTPTVLRLLNLPVGEDLDGRVLTEAFRPEFLAQHPVRRQSSNGRDGLGWLRLLESFRWRRSPAKW